MTALSQRGRPPPREVESTCSWSDADNPTARLVYCLNPGAELGVSYLDRSCRAPIDPAVTWHVDDKREDTIGVVDDVPLEQWFLWSRNRVGSNLSNGSCLQTSVATGAATGKVQNANKVFIC